MDCIHSSDVSFGDKLLRGGVTYLFVSVSCTAFMVKERVIIGYLEIDVTLK